MRTNWSASKLLARWATSLLLAAAATISVGAAGNACGQPVDPWVAVRDRMAREVLEAGGISDPRVLESVRSTPRHEFVQPQQRSLAYVDMALPIGEAQTISGIFVVAYMTEQLQPAATDRVLEIGTGSGYQAAVLSPLVAEVYSIEIHEPLGRRAARTLQRLGYQNVFTKIGDGFAGWPEKAPFDKIIVTCSPEAVPQPLVEQLAEGGRMIIPVGTRYDQILVLLTKRDGQLVQEALVPSLFVPMTGEAEDDRVVQPDGTRPSLANGGFEEQLPDSETPTAWYYGRQVEALQSPTAADGAWLLRLENRDAGRPAHIFQGFPVDGREVRSLDVSLSVRAENVVPGATPTQIPAVVIRFFNENRSRSSLVAFGDWSGSFEWRKQRTTMPVPHWAREAILQVGLMGATGRLEVDGVAVAAASAE
ncbi:MAG: protein-L-isoaspartate(D-aspartate) O-methyltransferase [Planctomycetota bacterium]|nr:protein-L-isoaspartate(D-aspartate) O-methyltransferase [Planctomycetota bacterium]